MLTAWDGQPVDTTVIREECEGDGCPRMIAVQLALVDTARPDGDLESLRASLPLHASRTCFDIILRYHGGWSGWLTRLVENVADGVYSPDNALLLADLGREFGLSLRPSPEWLRWLIADSRLVLTWPAGASADIVLLWTAGRSLVLPSPLKRALSIVQKIRSLTSVCPSLLQTPPHIGVRVPTAPLTRVGSMTSDSVFRCVLPFVDIETACWEALVVGFLDLAQVSEDPSISEQGLFKALLLELFQSSLDIPSRLSAARRAAMTRPAGDTLYLTALMSSLEGFFLSMGAPEQGPDRQAFETVLCETDVSVDAFAAFLSAEF
ncbi:MAG: hypothetical protein KVP17_000827 [Porospora cf. gigantea B]|nr:MAG: hypothetical protein KVP17_000827 [Porospora cf. gigantea B]